MFRLFFSPKFCHTFFVAFLIFVFFLTFQKMETDDTDGNELGCWSGVSCAAANGENHGDVDSGAWRESVHAVLKN